MLKGLRTVALQVADLEATKAWYTDVLGYGPYSDEPYYVGFDVGGYELGLQPRRVEVPAPGRGTSMPLWAVDDVTTAVERLVRLGATVETDTRGVGDGIVVASLRDPFGHPLGLIFNPVFAPKLASAGVGDLSERQIVREAVVPVSADEAWRAWATSEGMASWWLDTTTIELTPGGRYELRFLPEDQAPAGFRGSEGCRVLSFLPGRMLSFTWNAPPHLPATRHERTWVVVETTLVDAEGDGQTCRVRLTHLGWPDAAWDTEPQWAETFAYFESAWSRVVELFAAKLGGEAG